MVKLLISAALFVGCVALLAYLFRFLKRAGDLCDVVRVMHRAPVGIVRLAGDGRITYLNPAARRLLRLENRVVEGFHFEDIVGPKAAKNIRKVLATASESPQLFARTDLTLESREAGDEFKLSFLAFKRWSLGKDSYVAVIHPDNSKDWFVINYYATLTERLVHDIKNPLMAIEAYLEGLASSVRAAGSQVPEEAELHLSKIHERVERVVKLTRQYQKVVSPELFEPREIELSELLRDWAQSRREKIPRDIRLQITGDHGPVRMQGDADLLEGLLDNMLGVILEDMLQGGAVHVSVRCIEGDQSEKYADQGWVRFEFGRDEASGFDGWKTPAPIVKDADSDAFRWAVIQRIVELHGGTLHTLSSPNDERVTLAVAVMLPTGCAVK